MSEFGTIDLNNNSKLCSVCLHHCGSIEEGLGLCGLRASECEREAYVVLKARLVSWRWLCHAQWQHSSGMVVIE